MGIHTDSRPYFPGHSYKYEREHLVTFVCSLQGYIQAGVLLPNKPELLRCMFPSWGRFPVELETLGNPLKYLFY